MFMTKRIATLGVALVMGVTAAGQQFPERPPADVTATMDRDQMMSQLGVSFISMPPKLEDPNRPDAAWPSNDENPEGNWTDADGNTITRGGMGLWVTYDNDSQNLYTPIDLLEMNNGRKITSEAEWWSMRRPEIKKQVEDLVWGRMPTESELPHKVEWQVEETRGEAEGVAYIEKKITGLIDTSIYPEVRDAPVIDVTLRIPADATGPVPVIIQFGGGRSMGAVWRHVSPEGWGAATFNPNSIQPDNGRGLTSYLIGLMNKGEWREPTDMGSLVAWAWGIGRLIDYFETDDSVDATKVGVSGHSRYGKGAFIAMAYEPRLAVAYPSCGGALGPSMVRRHYGQNLENLSWDREYHWIAGNAFQWMGPLNEGEYKPRKVEVMPVDAHSVLALAAPRPVFLNGGNRDTWSDTYGTYLTGVGATPVYELLGKKGVVVPGGGDPAIDVAYNEGDIGYRSHDGGHTPEPDWPAFVAFTKKYFDAD